MARVTVPKAAGKGLLEVEIGKDATNGAGNRSKGQGREDKDAGQGQGQGQGLLLAAGKDLSGLLANRRGLDRLALSRLDCRVGW